MRTKPPAHSTIFDSRFLIGLCVLLCAVFLLALVEFATADPSRLSLTSSIASAQSKLAKHARQPLGEQCASLRGPIQIISESSGITSIDTVPAAFNSQVDEFLIAWDQLIGSTWTIDDQRLSVDGTLLGENNPIIEGSDTFIEPAVAYNADANQYFVTWRFQGGGSGFAGLQQRFRPTRGRLRHSGWRCGSRFKRRLRADAGI